MPVSAKRRILVAALAGLLATIAGTSPAAAITFGHIDGQEHPNVGALLADVDPESPGPEAICSGTLIAHPVDEPVFLTASHCTAFLESVGISKVWVTFAPAFDDDDASPAGLFAGTYVTHPRFGSGGSANTFDIAVVLLDKDPDITPARLPAAGLLDTLQADHSLTSKDFTAVGYGVTRTEKKGGRHSLYFDGQRRYALVSALNVRPAWLFLSANPSTGNGGTCYGDSGGPHFLGGVDSNLVVAITIRGDRWCRASDVSYRLDTRFARDFLRPFVVLP